MPATDPGRLAELLHAGKLVAEYRSVPALLAGATDAELASAGRLLSRLDVAEVHAAHPSVPGAPPV